MSEDERLRRQRYKKNRKKWIFIQALALALVLAFVLTSFLVYDRMNRTYYIEYSENGTVDYKVNLKENNFFEEDFLGAGQSYISSLIENVGADFKYELAIDETSVSFDYSYFVDAQLIIANKETGDHIYAPVYNLVPETKGFVKERDSLKIGTNVNIDYNQYNKTANTFITTYGLKNTSSTLVVTMTVKVLSTCSEFEGNNNEGVYFVALNIPLVEENFSMFVTSSNTEGQSKVLACSNGVSRSLFLAFAVAFGIIAAIQAIVLTAFVFITRNEDVNYTNKVRKIVSSYRSFIQQIDGQFDTTGYHVVPLKTFKEMLNIRDTIQSPILMFENLDQTVTEFVIPTGTGNILYTFEIKVDNYDAIYAPPQPKIIEEDIPQEDIDEAMAMPDIVLEEINYIEDNDEELDEGIEVVGVVWPEKAKKNKVYRYDPNGEKLEKGDIVLAPTMDYARNREVLRKAAISHGNHKIDPAQHPYKLKKIIGVIRRQVETSLTPPPDEASAKAKTNKIANGDNSDASESKKNKQKLPVS